MEQALRNAIYALNTALSQTEGPAERHALMSARDRAWAVGVRKYGWTD